MNSADTQEDTYFFLIISYVFNEQDCIAFKFTILNESSYIKTSDNSFSYKSLDFYIN